LPWIGQLRDSQAGAMDVGFWSKADIAASPTDVRFTPKSGHWNSVAECPLCAKSGPHASQHSCGYFCDWVERLWRLFVHYNGRQNWTAKIKACCKSFGHRRSRAKAADNISCEAAGGTNFAAHRGDTLRG